MKINRCQSAQLERFIINKHEEVSNWDSTKSKIEISDIDTTVLANYIKRANDAGRLDYPYTEAEDILTRLKLMENGGINNTADVMFSKNPRTELQMAIFATEERLTFIDINRIEGRIIDLVDVGERYIRSNMRYRVIIDGTQIARKEIPEVPHVAIREALLNSFCHKNFRTPQNNEVAIYSNRIEIYNPGTFPAGKTPEDFINGSSRSIHRNPLLAQIMYYPKDIESFGTGLKRIAEACIEAGVKYEFVSDNYGFTVVFYRPELPETKEKAHDVPTNVLINVPINVRLNEMEKQVLLLIYKNPHITAAELAQCISKTPKTAQRYINSLREKNLICRVGAKKDGYWEVVE